jgi:hypothetical protein
MDWIDLAQYRDRWLALVNVVMNLSVPWNAGNFLTWWEMTSFSKRTLLHGVSKEVRKQSTSRPSTCSEVSVYCYNFPNHIRKGTMWFEYVCTIDSSSMPEWWCSHNSLAWLLPRSTHPRCQFACMTTFWMAAPNVCHYSVRTSFMSAI